MDLERLPTTAISLTAGKASGKKSDIRQKAEEFEAVFLTPMIDEMFKSVNTGFSSGGYAEDTWKSLMAFEYAKAIAEQGNTGIAGSVEKQLEMYNKGK